MNVNEFISRLKQAEAEPTIYKLGCFGTKFKGKYRLWDCSGLIKGILWGYPDVKYKSNDVPDVNAYGLINRCHNVSTNFNKIEKGEIVWLDGHCGVYIGDSKVIESSPIWENGVQVTKLSQRKWKKHGFLPWIDYEENTSLNVSGTLDSAITTIAQYVIKGQYGNGHEKRSSNIYNDIRNLVNGKSISREIKLKNALEIVANEVKKGTFSNGHEKREKNIYKLVRERVNKLI